MDTSLEERVNVTVGLSRNTNSDVDEVPELCLIGAVPSSYPWFGETKGVTVVRSSRQGVADHGWGAEHLRVSTRLKAQWLPGLQSSHPSRLRDAFTLVGNANRQEVDFLIVRIPNGRPWDLDNPEINPLIQPFISRMIGTTLVFPDAGGPWGARGVDPEQRLQRLKRTVQAFGPSLTEYRQIGLMDMVEGVENGIRDFAQSVSGNDVALCHAIGSPKQRRRHGWRPVCAALGAHFRSKAVQLGVGISGQAISLGKGRHFTESREVALGRTVDTTLNEVVSDMCALLRIRKGDTCEVVQTPTLRRPLGDWNLSALRLVKLIHDTLLRVADGFVFRPSNEMEATVFGASVSVALQPFYDAGLLVGPGGVGPPSIKSGVVREGGTPGLCLDLTAQVQPICQDLSLRVNVEMGDTPKLSHV